MWKLPWAVLALLAAMPAVASAQQRLTASDAVNELDRLRDEAEPLWRAGDPVGLEDLDRAWAFLEEPAVADLVRGSVALQTRIPNLARETACAHAILGDTAQALDGLARVRDTGGSYSIMVPAVERSCPELFALRTLGRWDDILAVWRADHFRWTSPSLRTAYRDTLPVEERVAGLSTLWYRIKEYLPGFDTAPGLDLDSLYLAYIPLVMEMEDTYGFYRLLERFVAAVGDAHTNVYFPEELASRRYARPPMMAFPVEGRPIVQWIWSPTLERLGVRRGQEIVSVDGVAVDEYVAERVAPYQSSSTPQDLAVRSYGYQLLAGDERRPIRLVLRDPDGSEVDVTLARGGYDDLLGRAVTRDTVLAGNIGYLRVDGFDADSLEGYLPAALERLAETDGLIVDVRYNGGGSSRHGYTILSALVDSPTVAASPRSRSIVPVFRAWGVHPPAYPLTPPVIQPSAEPRYERPVVVLTGPMTFSAAEDFAMTFDALALGTIVGEPTAGSTGQPFSFGLPGGGWARVRAKHDSYPDGRQFIGTGVQPDILVRPTIEGVRAGRDEVLERGVEEIERRLRASDGAGR